MARKRTAPQTNHTDTKESNNMSDMFTELTEDEITEAQSKARTRGEYDVALQNFLDSGSRGVAVSTEVGMLAGKNVGAIKSGLDNARKRLLANEATKAAGESVKIVLFKKDKDDPGQVRIYRTDAAA